MSAESKYQSGYPLICVGPWLTIIIYITIALRSLFLLAVVLHPIQNVVEYIILKAKETGR